MKKILISGMYGADNLGDDYILMSITDNIYRQYGADTSVAIISNGKPVDWLLEKHPGCKVVSCDGNKYKKVVLTLREIIGAKCLIFGGGGYGLLSQKSNWHYRNCISGRRKSFIVRDCSLGSR